MCIRDSLYFRWGKAHGDRLFYDDAIEALDRASDGVPGDNTLEHAKLRCTRGIINCHRGQFATAGRDFEKSIAYFTSLAGGNDSNFDPVYFVAVRNQERLQESFILTSGLAVSYTHLDVYKRQARRHST